MNFDTAHATHDLIADLHEIRRSADGIEGFEHAARIGGYAVCHDRIRFAFPRCRSLDMGGVNPCIGVMKIQHEEGSCILNTLTEGFDILDVLAYRGVGCSVMVFLRRIDKDTDAEGIPTAIIDEERDEVGDIVAKNILVGRVVFLIQWQGRDVSADIALRCFLRLRTEASEGAKE